MVVSEGWGEIRGEKKGRGLVMILEGIVIKEIEVKVPTGTTISELMESCLSLAVNNQTTVKFVHNDREFKISYTEVLANCWDKWNRQWGMKGKEE